MEIIFFPDRGSNPFRWTQSPTLYHVAIKAGLYRRAVQVYHIPIPGDILPLQIEIRPWISRSPRITWNETRGVICIHVGYLRRAPNVTVEKMEMTFFPDRGSNPVRWTRSPTLYHVYIKAGLYRNAVQVYHIPIPGDIYLLIVLLKMLLLSNIRAFRSAFHDGHYHILLTGSYQAILPGRVFFQK